MTSRAERTVKERRRSDGRPGVSRKGVNPMRPQRQDTPKRPRRPLKPAEIAVILTALGTLSSGLAALLEALKH